jgi:pyruvate/2-oxoacid:ferredoxin oxidoreductase beta subunit
MFYFSLTGLLSRGQQEVGEAQHRVEQRLATNSRQNFSGFNIVQIYQFCSKHNSFKTESFFQKRKKYLKT